jgi:HPt (histidine-containing phosphotransfer) domain-containing protein
MVAVPDSPDEDDAERALRSARERCIGGLAGRLDGFEAMVRDIEAGRAAVSTVDQLAEDVHRLAGLAGMVGLPTVSERSRDLENILRDALPHVPDGPATRRALDALRAARDADLAAEPPDWVNRA